MFHRSQVAFCLLSSYHRTHEMGVTGLDSLLLMQSMILGNATGSKRCINH